MSDREFLAAHGVHEALTAAVAEVLSTRPSNPILAIRDILIAKEAARALSEGLGEMGTDPNWQFKYSKRKNAYGMGIYAEVRVAHTAPFACGCRAAGRCATQLVRKVPTVRLHRPAGGYSSGIPRLALRAWRVRVRVLHRGMHAG